MGRAGRSRPRRGAQPSNSPREKFSRCFAARMLPPLLFSPRAVVNGAGRSSPPRLLSGDAAVASLGEEARPCAAGVGRGVDGRLGRLQRGDDGPRQGGACALRRSVRARRRQARCLSTLGSAWDAGYLAGRLHRPELGLGWRRPPARTRSPCVRDRPAALRVTERKGPYTLGGWVDLVRAFERPGAGHLSMLAAPDAIAKSVDSFAGPRKRS